MTTVPKERGIGFSTSMIPPILKDRKDMTRRLTGLQKLNDGYLKDHVGLIKHERDMWYFYEHPAGASALPSLSIKCPYGQVGDRLWVRETWGFVPNYPPIAIAKYKADHGSKAIEIPSTYKGLIYKELKWRSARFMPRWASRILLEITNIRMERLQEITQEDIEREGLWYWSAEYRSEICKWRDSKEAIEHTRLKYFEKLWDSLNGKKYPWSLNPWVWVILFKKLKG